MRDKTCRRFVPRDPRGYPQYLRIGTTGGSKMTSTRVFHLELQSLFKRQSIVFSEYLRQSIVFSSIFDLVL